MTSAMKVCPHCGSSFVPHLHQIFCTVPCRTVYRVRKWREKPNYHERKSFEQMRDRCYRPKHHAYARYGGRGITVCERWVSFENFLADMGKRPSLDHTLDRINNDGNYEPKNCRWATRTEQSRNRLGVFSDEENQAMLDGIARGLTWRQIGFKLGRTESAIAAKASREGWKSGYRRSGPSSGEVSR